MSEELEIKLAKAVKDITPDVLERVMKESVIPMDKPDEIINQKLRRRKSHYRNMMYVAATLAAVFCMVIGIGWYQFFAADSIVGLDVNPSLEFVVNRQNRVTEVQTYNQDARKVTESLDLKNVEIHTAVSAVLGSMLQHGYINTEQNTVLLTVQNADSSKAQKLEQNLMADIDNVLSGAGTKGRLVSQVIEEEQSLEELSEDYHISYGKMQVIENILKQDANHTREELSKMSVQELMELIGEEQLNMHGHMQYEEQEFCGEEHTSESGNTSDDESDNNSSGGEHHGNGSGHGRKKSHD